MAEPRGTIAELAEGEVGWVAPWAFAKAGNLAFVQGNYPCFPEPPNRFTEVAMARVDGHLIVDGEPLRGKLGKLDLSDLNYYIKFLQAEAVELVYAPKVRH